ncbi:DNA translocase FtsK [Bosea sp. (in: a-proteobacteria)]|uniref:DNA translocase FtsK n=1 Tax=Bosea sp. (in: a-proteobacteria) TaxID=1871050 RepID=UPI0026113C4E|nr:DNA translocase FtsK [Bosea sp. (in: a-proteobacteria)]MCO5090837.1 FtsK/SpoIIIE domain-containing protein [Bosea sp. (in: a-proteobacteria)]
MHKLDRHRRANAVASEDHRLAAPPGEPAELWPTYVRPSRAAEAQRRLSQAESELAAVASRVRYWRTPDHLIRQVWGTPAAVPTVEEPVPAEAPLDDAEACGEMACEAPAEVFAAPEQVAATALDFISDHAFWECVPAAERDDSGFEIGTAAPPVAATFAIFEEPAPALPEASLPEAASPAVSAAVAPPAWPGPGWGQGYRVSVRIAAPAWREPVAETCPVEDEPPVPDEPVATVKQGVPLARSTRPPVVPEPVMAEPEPVPAEPAPFRAAPRLVTLPVAQDPGFQLPPIEFLAEPPQAQGEAMPVETLQQNAGLLEGVLEDFNIRGEIVQACPGPVVTLYELEPAPGTKSSRVISLADDIARSMSAVSARVAVVQGKNAIGIELPNARRETVFLRELLASQDFETTRHKLALCLGKTIGGEPVIADLARMPHLLVAGTTGSGKSVAINTMILSILYRLKPEECRLIMVDPKMLELSVYDGIPHLLTPVVTDPKKAVVALKWAVREMEERYKKMSKLSVRNIDGFNARVQEAKAAGEVITRTVQTGFDRHSGEAIYEDEVMDLEPLPYIVVIVDEMADLMMVAGKEIEGTIQRLAQMARAAGIHVVLATQRPSVDVITGTIKANFPTRISFQVTSKIDSRTILGEMGAEQLLGQGDMLYMAGGGRITRVHGPFVSDAEVEKVVAHLKTQGRPQYLDAVTCEDEDGADDEGGAVFDKTGMGACDSDDPYEQAVAVVLRDRKASTSYIQRRLQIGYNRAASIMERMENEGIVGPANHAGKREILRDGGPLRDDED